MDSDKDQNITEIKKDEFKQPEEQSDLTENYSTPVKKSDEQALSSQELRNKRMFVIGAVLVGIIIFIVISFFISQKKDISKPQKSPEPTVAVTLTPTPTPKPTFDRSEWSIEVLNGSGVTGAAKKLADKLESLGYKILKTGNVDRSDYKVSELFVAKDMKDKQDLLLEDLKDTVKIASVAGELKDSTASARIIIGTQ